MWKFLSMISSCTYLLFLIPSFLHLYMILMIVQECTNPRHLVSYLGDRFYIGASYFQHNYCISFFFTCRNAYHFTCTEQKVPDNSEVHISGQNCGSSVWNLLHVAHWRLRIWRWILDFGKICGPLVLQ